MGRGVKNVKTILAGFVVCTMCLIQCMDDNIYIPEYTNRNLGINCMEIKIDDTYFFEAIF